MLEKIQQAETAIKAGDTRTGFQILREVLAKNPNSERAWWVMSGLVPREQRAHCLNQVLRINPNNQLARETLEKFRPVKPEIEPAEKPSPPQEKGSLGEYQIWLYSQRSRIYLTLLGKEELISAETDPKNLARIRAAISEGEMPDALFKEKTVVPFNQITSAKQVISALTVYYQVEGRKKHASPELENEEMANQVLSVLHNKLAPSFSLIAEPMKTTTALIISLILTISAAALTAFLYWGANEVASGRASATGSIRTQSIIRLLDLLGPGGVVVIGGILILLSLGVSTWLLLKPPTVTELKRE
jgi:hypothetical protein